MSEAVKELERKLAEAKTKAAADSMASAEEIMKSIDILLTGRYIMHGNGSSYGSCYVAKVERCTIEKTTSMVVFKVILSDKYVFSNAQNASYTLTLQRPGIRLGPCQVIFNGVEATVVSPVTPNAPNPGTERNPIYLFSAQYSISNNYYTIDQFKRNVENNMKQVYIIKQEVFDMIKGCADKHFNEHKMLWEAVGKVNKRAVDTKLDCKIILEQA